MTTVSQRQAMTTFTNGRAGAARRCGCCLVVACLATAALGGEEGQGPEVEARDYAEGPLTATDFRAPAPANAGEMLALTTTDLRYNLQYRVARRKERFAAEITSFEVRAVVVPGASWNRNPKDARLLDHEQGHFDLTHIAALRARSEFTAANWPSGDGATDKEALADLRKRVTETMAEWVAALTSEHRRYDKVTRHGRDGAAQIAERRRQEELARALTARLKGN